MENTKKNNQTENVKKSNDNLTSMKRPLLNPIKDQDKKIF